jgi:RNA polymerase sigma-70 factor (ECF subfamily)
VTDAELVEHSLAGREDAFRGLVVRHQRSVYNLLARMLRNPSRAEELAQETFLKAFKNLRSFDPAFKFSNWILRIAHNAAIDAMRRSGPQEVSLDEPDDRSGSTLAEAVPDPHGEQATRALEHQDLARALGAALRQLRPEYRRMVVLRYQEDLGYEEIAQITGLPLGTVKSHLHRARSEMAGFLRRQGLG